MVVAVRPRVGELLDREPVDAHVAPGRVVGRQVGDVGEAGPLPRRVVVVQDGRATAEPSGHDLCGPRVQRDRAQVLDDDQIGVGQRRRRPRRRSGGSAAPMARPGRIRSASPSPATVVTEKPRASSDVAQLSATIETPSVPPRRKETMAQVGTGGPPGGA